MIHDSVILILPACTKFDVLLFALQLAIVGLKLPIFCRLCSKAKHIMENCPDEKLPPCVPLPPPSKEHRQLLSQLLEDIKCM